MGVNPDNIQVNLKGQGHSFRPRSPGTNYVISELYLTKNQTRQKFISQKVQQIGSQSLVYLQTNATQCTKPNNIIRFMILAGGLTSTSNCFIHGSKLAFKDGYPASLRTKENLMHFFSNTDEFCISYQRSITPISIINSGCILQPQCLSLKKHF